MKKPVKVVIYILLLLILVTTVWYYWPIHREFTMPVCSLEGQAETLEADYRIYRSFFHPAVIKGTFRMGEGSYMDYETMGVTTHYDFQNGLTNKYVHGWQYESLIFHLDTNDFINDIGKSLMIAGYTGRNAFETVHIYVSYGADTEDVDFYGPAATAEEAQAVYDMLYKN